MPFVEIYVRLTCGDCDQGRLILTTQAWKQIHCHLAIGYCTISQRVFDCKHLICRSCFHVLNYVFILFIFNLYRLLNIQQVCHNSSQYD